MDKPPKPYQLDGIRPGQLWDTAITENIAQSSCFLAFLSKTSVSKKGYVQREYRLALENMGRMPSGQVFLVPVLLESDCPLPQLTVDSFRFQDLQWFDLESDGLKTLIRFLNEELSPEKELKEFPNNAIIEVSSITDFFHSVGSNRTLKLGPTAYLLTSEMAEGQFGEHIHIRRVFDGWQFNIRNVNNMKIDGKDRRSSQFLVNARYPFVFSFEKCANIGLSTLTLAHSPPGYCTGGVVRLDSCRDVTIRDCDLHGSGTYGFEINDVDGLLVEDSEVSHCTYGIMNIVGLQKGIFRNVEFRDNRTFSGINAQRSKRIEFENCNLFGNTSNHEPLLAIYPDSDIVWRGGAITLNNAKALCYLSRNTQFIGANIKNNSFEV